MKRILAMILCLMLALSTAAIAERDPLFEDLPELVELDLWVDWSWVGFDTYEGGVARGDDRSNRRQNQHDEAIDSERLSMMISQAITDLVVCSSSPRFARLRQRCLLSCRNSLSLSRWEISETEKAMNATT